MSIKNNMVVRSNISGVICGDQNFTIPSHMNYGKLVLDKMLKYPENIALIDAVTDEQTTYREMAQYIVNTADALMRLGVKRNEVVAVCSENRKEFLITVIASWCSGATLTVLNAGYSRNEMTHCMSISKPKYMFLSPDTYKKYYDIMINTKLVDKFFTFGNTKNNPKITSFNEIIKTHVDIESFKLVVNKNGLVQTAVILYSSGTTGLQKGAKLTHLNLIASSNQPHCTSPNNLRCLSTASWSSTVGILLTMKELTKGKTAIYFSKYNKRFEEQYLRCIEKHKAGMLLIAPPLIVTLAKSPNIKKYDVNSVKVMYVHGAPLESAFMNEIKQKFPKLVHILQGYGMTEATGPLTEETTSHFKSGSVGKAVLGAIIKIVDLDTRKSLGPHQQGEVCLKGPVLFDGYIGKDISDDLDEEGYLKTGDICFYDKDGYFYFVDRVKELIKYETKQVSPVELEAILLQHPAVKEVGVVGKPDPAAGELPTAFVVKNPGVNVTPKALIDFIADQVAPWKQLRGGVYFIEEIPKVPNGKILRRRLREYLNKPVSKL